MKRIPRLRALLMAKDLIKHGFVCKRNARHALSGDKFIALFWKLGLLIVSSASTNRLSLKITRSFVLLYARLSNTPLWLQATFNLTIECELIYVNFSQVNIGRVGHKCGLL